MKIRVKDLLDLILLLKPVVPKKPTIKALAYIRLGEGKAMASDLETMVIVAVPEAVDDMLLPHAVLAETLKYVPGTTMLEITSADRKITLVWPEGSGSFPTESLLDFPQLPELPVRAEGNLDGDTLIPAMLAALTYAAIESTRPTLNGVSLVLGNPIEVAAADGFRMSHKTLGIVFPIEEKIIVPSRSVTILGHVFAKTPRTPPLDAPSLIPVITAKRFLRTALVGENKLQVSFGTKVIVVCTLIEGDAPNFLQLVPKDDPILQSEIFAPQMEALVKRVRATAKDGTGLICMKFADGKITVSAKAGDGEIEATMDTLATQGEPGEMGLDQKYLLSFLAGKQGIFTLSQYSASAPLVFEYQNDPKVLIMPMQVENKAAAAETEEPAATEETEADEETEETEETAATEEPVEPVEPVEPSGAVEAEIGAALPIAIAPTPGTEKEPPDS